MNSLFWRASIICVTHIDLAFVKIQMAVMISVGFVIAWTPYVTVSFWSMFHARPGDHLRPFLTLLPCLFAKSSTVYNPFIYFIFQRSTRREQMGHRKRDPGCFDCCCCGRSERSNAAREGKTTTDCNWNGTEETMVGLTGCSTVPNGKEIVTIA